MSDPNVCNHPNPDGGSPCCRPLGHHVLTAHWDGTDTWNDGDGPQKVTTVRVGMRMKWAPMLGYDVPDYNTGVDLILMDDGSVRWVDPKATS